MEAVKMCVGGADSAHKKPAQIPTIHRGVGFIQIQSEQFLHRRPVSDLRV